MVELPEFLSSSPCFLVDGWNTRLGTKQIGHWQNPVRNLWMPAKADTKTGLRVKGCKSYPISLEMHMENANPT